MEDVVPQRIVSHLFHGNLLDVLPEDEEPEEQIHEAVQNQGQGPEENRDQHQSVEDAQEQVEEAAQVPGEQVVPVSRGRSIEMFRRLSGFNRPRGIIM